MPASRSSCSRRDCAGVSNPAAPGSPNSASAAAPGAVPSDQANPLRIPTARAARAMLRQPHITIATPAPAPAPWPLQERISWAANLILVLIAYVGVHARDLRCCARSNGRRRLCESAAQAAADSAKAALMYAEAQAQAQRPWLVVTRGGRARPQQQIYDRGHESRPQPDAESSRLSMRSRLRRTMRNLPPAPDFQKRARAAAHSRSSCCRENRRDSRSFSRDDVKSVCETAEDLRRVEAVGEQDLSLRQRHLYGLACARQASSRMKPRGAAGISTAARRAAWSRPARPGTTGIRRVPGALDLRAGDCLPSRAAHRHPVQLHRRHAHAHRHALAVFAAGADAFVELQVVAHHRHVLQRLGPVADQRASRTGAVTLPSSIRYASDAENTNLPFVMSTWPPPKFTA